MKIWIRYSPMTEQQYRFWNSMHVIIQKLLHFALLHYALEKLLHFALVLHFALILHFAAIISFCGVTISFCTYVWRWKESWRHNIQDVLDGLGWNIFSILPLGSWARMKSRRVSITDHSFHTLIEWRRFLFLSNAVCFYPPPPLFPKRRV